MIWDDHEIVDGWGSHYLESENGLRRMLPNLENRGLNDKDGLKLMDRMFRAARHVYMEYQHSHNPYTQNKWQLDYSFRRSGCAFYVLDGRGQRKIKRKNYRILGPAQFKRFSRWVRSLAPEETPFLFVVSAVPILHTRTVLVQADKLLGELSDDLRDAWEHELHDAEREELMDVLFDAASRGIRVSVLSGDVHVSAVFSIENDKGYRIYQLTSSSITYNLTRPQS